MNRVPPADWELQWQGANIRVFQTGQDGWLSRDEVMAVLSIDERYRAQRFHFPRDRERWMCSRAMLRLCLGEAMQCSAAAVKFGSGTWGKPCLYPAVPGVEFNLSHSGDYTAVAIGRRVVGVDMETWQQELAAGELAEAAFDPRETAAIRESPEPQRHFLRLWTAKEAVMKCCGLGLTIPPASVRVRCEEGYPVAARRTDFHQADFPDPAVTYRLGCYEIAGAWTLTAAVEQMDD